MKYKILVLRSAPLSHRGKGQLRYDEVTLSKEQSIVTGFYSKDEDGIFQLRQTAIAAITKLKEMWPAELFTIKEFM